MESVERDDDPPADRIGASVPTAPLGPVGDLLAHANEYLKRFTGGATDRGKAVAMRGDHGTGKTHTIRYVIGRLGETLDTSGTDGNQPEGASQRRVLQVYAKADGPDFVALYGTIVAQIPHVTLYDASLRFLGMLAGQEVTRGGSRERGQETVAALERAPDRIFELFGSYVVEEGKIQSRQSSEIDRLTGGRRDFRKALSYLGSEELGQKAYDWLRGRNLDASDLRKLGVSGPIGSADVAKWGLQLIVSMIARTGLPLIIYIDQYEKLVLNGEFKLIEQNAGVLLALADAIPDERAMFVISGNQRAWESLTPDIRQRFADNVIELGALTLPEAKQVIHVYVTSGREASSRDPSDAELYPFTGQAVRAMLAQGGSNLRRLLQLCSIVFDAAAEDRRLIDQTSVDQTLRTRSKDRVDRARVEREIAKILASQRVPIARHYLIRNRPVDFAIIDGTGVPPRLVIQISDAMFHEYEAREALRTLSVIESLDDQAEPVQVVLVVVGYASQEVIDHLQSSQCEVLVYRPETFEAQLRPIVTRVMSAAATAVPRLNLERDQLKTELGDMRRNLEEIVRSRDADVRALENRLLSIVQQQARERSDKRRVDARRDWVDARQQIEQDIAKARASRREAELQELERLRTEAERDQRVVLWVAGALSMGVIVITGSVYIISTMMDVAATRTILRQVVTWTPLAALLGLLLLAVLNPRAMRYLPSWVRFRELRRRVASVAELNRTAAAFSRLAKKQFGYLMHPNPQIRYAAARNNELLDLQRRSQLLASERCGAVRRALAQVPREAALVDLKNLADIANPVEALAGLYNEAHREVAYIVESLAAASQERIYFLYDVVPRRLHPVVAIAGQRDHDLLFATLAAAGVPREETTEKALLELWRSGFDRQQPDIPLAEIPESTIRRVLRVLSPFDLDGLGSLDDLAGIDRIDDLYLFFRQLLFLNQRGAFTAED